jgi:hypothetical protein
MTKKPKDNKIYNMDLFEKKLTGVLPAKISERNEAKRERDILKCMQNIEKYKKEVEELEGRDRPFFLKHAKASLQRAEKRYVELTKITTTIK